jgi:uncharacterized membrane protein
MVDQMSDKAEVIVVSSAQVPIRPRGKDKESALRAWLTNEVTKASERTYDLGKFLFTVSIGTAGLVATLFKTTKTLLAIVAIVSSFVSAAIALSLAWPKEWRLDGDTDLERQYLLLITKVRRAMWWWVGAYTIAAAFSLWAICTQP